MEISFHHTTNASNFFRENKYLKPCRHNIENKNQGKQEKEKIKQNYNGNISFDNVL